MSAVRTKMMLLAGMSVIAIGCGRIGFTAVELSDEGADIDAAIARDAAESIDAAAELVDAREADATSTQLDPDAGLSARAQCCEAWCQDGDRFDGETFQSNAFEASAATCTSSTGCTCAVSALIANSWTIISGDVCDAHNFWDACEGSCDGSQCPLVTIGGRLDSEGTECVCVGRSEIPVIEEDIWSSTCAENVGNTPFLDACPLPPSG